MPREESSGEQSHEKKVPEPSDSLDGGYQSDFEELLHAVATPENAVKKQEAWAWILNVEIEFKSPSGIEFVLIPAGTFTMGSRITRQVTITKPFYMGKYQVTQVQWKMFMNKNPSHFKGDNRPVENVSWNDCQEFIRKLDASEGVNKYRLPAEAEWEYACRAGTTTEYCFGDDEDQLDQYTWFGEDWRSGSTHPVGQKKPNTWGLYDMHGNVYEWCQDWYGDYPTSPVTDPAGPSSGSARVIRGGSWNAAAGRCTASIRGSYDARGARYGSVGFRLMRSL